MLMMLAFLMDINRVFLFNLLLNELVGDHIGNK